MAATLAPEAKACTVKQCPGCGRTLPLAQFNQDRSNHSGRKSRCRDCYNAARRTPSHRASDNARQRRRRLRPSVAASLNAYNAEYRKRPEAVARERERDRNRANDPKRKAATNAQRSRYRARARNAEQDGHSAADLASSWDERGLYLCATCDAPVGYAPGSLHVEHGVPLSRGGAHTVGNLTPSCEPCNLSKGARTLADWRPDLWASALAACARTAARDAAA